MSGVCFFFGMDLRLILYRKSGLLDVPKRIATDADPEAKNARNANRDRWQTNVLLIFEAAHTAVNSRPH